ncbi:MAG TPA: hypothetical protein PKC79_03435 [Solidesulfovibrio magneticus]|nr:hypothetical protein [Solidesulfovibrio magneticus]
MARKRAIPAAEMNTLVSRFIADHKHDQATKVTIDQDSVAKAYNISTGLVEKIFLAALREGLDNVVLAESTHSSKGNSAPYINAKGSLIIGKDLIASLNNQLNPEFRLAGTIKIEIMPDGTGIILTKAA